MPHIIPEPPAVNNKVPITPTADNQDEQQRMFQTTFNILTGLKNMCRLRQDSPDRSDILWSVVSIALAEFIGTGILMFLGCMGGVKGWSSNDTSPLQGPLCFGLTVMCIIQIFGHVSKAHLNPAVTICSVILGFLTVPMAILYVAAQCAGATLGYGLITLVTPSELLNRTASAERGFCTTLPAPEVSVVQALAIEALVTGILIFLVCGVWDSRNDDNQDSVALKFGLTVACISLAAGPYTGASMNPARTLGPSVWTGIWDQHWIYWLGPCGSAILVTFFYRYVFDRKPKTSEDEGSLELDDVLSAAEAKVNRDGHPENIIGNNEKKKYTTSGL